MSSSIIALSAAVASWSTPSVFVPSSARASPRMMFGGGGGGGGEEGGFSALMHLPHRTAVPRRHPRDGSGAHTRVRERAARRLSHRRVCVRCRPLDRSGQDQGCSADVRAPSLLSSSPHGSHNRGVCALRSQGQPGDDEEVRRGRHARPGAAGGARGHRDRVRQQGRCRGRQGQRHAGE